MLIIKTNVCFGNFIESLSVMADFIIELSSLNVTTIVGEKETFLPV